MTKPKTIRFFMSQPFVSFLQHIDSAEQTLISLRVSGDWTLLAMSMVSE